MTDAPDTTPDEQPIPEACADHDCNGQGFNRQGWTDKRGYSEDQYGPCGTPCKRETQDPDAVRDALAIRAAANNARRATLLDTPDHPLRPLALTLDDYNSLAARNHRWAQEAGTDTRNHDIYYCEATTFEIAAHLLTVAIDKTLDNLENPTNGHPTTAPIQGRDYENIDGEHRLPVVKRVEDLPTTTNVPLPVTCWVHSTGMYIMRTMGEWELLHTLNPTPKQ